MNKVFSSTAIAAAIALTTVSLASSVESPKNDGGGGINLH